ncbi:MAG TPA: acyltransferase [Flavobacterium sp.]
MMQENKPRLFGLDLMRALAIIMVLFGHSIWIFPENRGPAFALMAFSGYFGVEMFFVLSGFLIGNILFRIYISEGMSKSVMLQFLRRRWLRTLPNYYLVLVLNLIIALIIGYNVTGFWHYLFFIQNFSTPMPPFFPESWTLSVEEFAYVLLPLFLLLFNTFVRVQNRNVQYLATVLLLIVLSVFSKTYYAFNNNNGTLQQWNAGLRMVTIYRLDAIFIGVLFSWISLQYKLLWIKIRFSATGLGIILGGFLLFGVGKFQLLIETHPFFWNVIYLPLTSVTAALFLPLLSQWKSARGLAARAIVFTSAISYAIYLLHYGIVLQLMKHFLVLRSGTTGQLCGFVIIYLFLTIALSSMLYRYYEKPIMDLRQRQLLK